MRKRLKRTPPPTAEYVEDSVHDDVDDSGVPPQVQADDSWVDDLGPGADEQVRRPGFLARLIGDRGHETAASDDVVDGYEPYEIDEWEAADDRYDVAPGDGYDRGDGIYADETGEYDDSDDFDDFDDSDDEASAGDGARDREGPDDEWDGVHEEDDADHPRESGFLTWLFGPREDDMEEWDDPREDRESESSYGPDAEDDRVDAAGSWSASDEVAYENAYQQRDSDEDLGRSDDSPEPRLDEEPESRRLSGPSSWRPAWLFGSREHITEPTEDQLADGPDDHLSGAVDSDEAEEADVADGADVAAAEAAGPVHAGTDPADRSATAAEHHADDHADDLPDDLPDDQPDDQPDDALAGTSGGAAEGDERFEHAASSHDAGPGSSRFVPLPTEDVGDRERDDRSRRPISARDLVLVASLLVVLVLTAVLVRSALKDQPAGTEASGGSSGRIPTPPAAAPEVGSYVESRVAANGDVRVRQWVRSRSPLLAVRLQMDALPAADRSPKATDVVVDSDQTLLNRPTSITSTGQRLFFSSPPRVVYLSYTLKGAVDISPSVPGRALARATAIRLDVSPMTGPSRVTLVSNEVLSMACSQSPVGAPAPCGKPGKHRWSVLLTGDKRDDTVMAQVNLKS